MQYKYKNKKRFDKNGCPRSYCIFGLDRLWVSDQALEFCDTAVEAEKMIRRMMLDKGRFSNLQVFIWSETAATYRPVFGNWLPGWQKSFPGQTKYSCVWCGSYEAGRGHCSHCEEM